MLKGKKVLVTAGPTHEPIDPVRFIGNRSSGKMGYAIAQEIADRDGDVTLISGPTQLIIKHERIKRVDIETAEEMYQATLEEFENCDIAILAAAVADFTPANKSVLKIKKQEGQEEMTLLLVKTKDILATLGDIKNGKQILVGFSLETDCAIANATKKLHSKKLDFIVLNSLRDEGAGFATDTNKITILGKNGDQIDFPLKEKSAVAIDIINYLEKIIVL